MRAIRSARAIRGGAAAAAIALVASAGGAMAADPATGASSGAVTTDAECARQFDEAQRVDMESFRDFDEATWLNGHHPQAMTIFADGARRQGIDAIATALSRHFVNKNAVWSWTELHRFVDGCSFGYVLYDATYAVPSTGSRQRALTSVSYIRQDGKWLSIIDQGTPLR